MIAMAVLLLQTAAPPASASCAWSPPRPERKMTGIYLDEFERQAFHEGVGRMDDIMDGRPAAWIDIDKASFPPGFRKAGRDRIYRVTIVGTERFPPSVSAIHSLPCAPTVPGRSRIDVPRVIEIEDVGPIRAGIRK